MRKVILLALGASLLSTSSFGADLASPEAIHPVTIASNIRHHDGQDFESFQVCQDGKCRVLGSAGEVPVKWIKAQAWKEDVKAVATPLGDILAGYGFIFVQFVPGINAIVDGSLAALGAYGTVESVGFMTVGTIGSGFTSKLSPHQQYLRARAAHSAANGKALEFKSNKDVLAFSEHLESVLNHYDTRSEGRIVVDDFHEAHSALDKDGRAVRDRIVKVYNGAVADAKDVADTMSGNKKHEAIVGSADSAN